MMNLALGVARGERFPIFGSSGSAGFPNPPLAAYLQAMPLLVSQSPLAVLAGHALLGVLAVLAVYVVGTRFYGPWVGLGSAALLAANPWALFFGRKIGTHLVPLFAVVIFALVLLTLESKESKGRWLPALALALALAGQHYLLAVLWTPVALVALAPVWRQIPVRRWLQATAVYLAVWVPYLIGLLRTGLKWPPDLGVSGAPRLGVEAIVWPFWLASGYHITDILGPEFPASHPLRLVVTGALALTILLTLAGAGLTIRWWRRERHGWVAWALLAWWLLPVLGFLVQVRRLDIAYLRLTMPADVLLPALGLAALGRSLPRAAAGAAVLLVGLQAAAGWSLYAELERRGSPALDVPVRAWLRLDRELERAAGQTGARQVFFFVRGVQPDFQGDPAALVSLAPPEPTLRFLDAQAGDFLVGSATEPALYVRTVPAGLVEDYATLLAQVTDPAAGPWAEIWLLPPLDPAALMQELEHPVGALFQGGLTLLGWEGPWREGDRLRWTLWWWVREARPRGQELSVFNHLQDAGGQLVAQDDGLGLPAYAWRPGDVLAQTYHVTGEARRGRQGESQGGPSTLLVGVYDLQSLERLALVDEAGRAVADAMPLGPFELGEAGK